MGNIRSAQWAHGLRRRPNKLAELHDARLVVGVRARQGCKRGELEAVLAYGALATLASNGLIFQQIWLAGVGRHAKVPVAQLVLPVRALAEPVAVVRDAAARAGGQAAVVALSSRCPQ